MLIKSVMYNRVLDSGNLFTKCFAEEVVRRFKEDNDFRSSIEFVQTETFSNPDRMELEWPYVALVLKELYLTSDCLMADAEVLDTPQGRIIKRLSECGSEFILTPRFMWEPLRVDGIDIISAGSYSWLSFVVRELRGEPTCLTKNNLKQSASVPLFDVDSEAESENWDDE